MGENRVKQKTILIVEDNAEFRMLLKQIVSDAGYRALAADNGEDGVAVAKREMPDMILLDIRLPRMDGYQVTRAVRADSSVARTPIILVSVQSNMAEIVKGLKLGADDYVIKPFDPEEIAARIESLFRHSASRGGSP